MRTANLKIDVGLLRQMLDLPKETSIIGIDDYNLQSRGWVHVTVENPTFPEVSATPSVVPAYYKDADGQFAFLEWGYPEVDKEKQNE